MTASNEGDAETTKNVVPSEDNDSSPQQQLNEEPPRDDEGLLMEYDVVLCGTGLVQSILASALTRAGKTVLHCDGSDNYGELDAVWTFGMIEELMKETKEEVTQQEQEPMHDKMIPLSPKGGMTSLKFHFQKTTKYFGIRQGTQVESSYGPAIVKSITRQQQIMISLHLELMNWKLANGNSPTVYVAFSVENADTLQNDPVVLEEYLDTHHQICTVESKEGQHLLKQQRFFALDATPACILASGQAVNGMLASNVADYLEFKAVEGQYWLEEGKEKFELSRVPCSKNDVFGTRLLPPMDKRRLMKFIQMSMDYMTKMNVAEDLLQQQQDTDTTTTHEDSSVLPESEVQTLNERHLNQGRSLARPQNKAVATNELEVLEECIEKGDMTFDEFLSKQYKLSPKLRSIVRYALAWETADASISLAEGITSLRQHLQALGRFGTTAFLVPMYGSGELSQAFCRSAAVFGATYLLRRAPIAVQYNDNSVTGILISGDKGGDDAVVASAEERQTADKVVKCKCVVAPAIALAKQNSLTEEHERRIVRRLVVLKGKIIASESGDQRHIIFMPPNTVGNTHAVHAVLMDFSARAAPNGCTLLHLTTTVQNEKGESLEGPSILERAQAAILSSGANGDIPAKELYSVCFSHACPDILAKDDASGLNGLHLCSHMGQSLTADVAFREAQRLFSTICPGMKFLGLANTFNEAIRERAEEKRYGDDDEKMMLESALGMIEDSPN